MNYSSKIKLQNFITKSFKKNIRIERNIPKYLNNFSDPSSIAEELCYKLLKYIKNQNISSKQLIPTIIINIKIIFKK